LRTPEQIRAYKKEWARKNRKPLTEEQKDKRAEYHRKWRLENAEKVKSNKKEYYEKDRERLKSRSREWHHANKERASKRGKDYRAIHDCELKFKAAAYREANRERLSESRRRRFREDPEYRSRVLARAKNTKAKRKGAEGKFTAEDVERIYQSQSGLCVGCGADLSASCQIDHKIPLSRGGSNWPSNLQLLCQPCNRSKGNKLPNEWADPRRAA
jgi:5-methylcytosine-specific restriction endonuclease McrA